MANIYFIPEKQLPIIDSTYVYPSRISNPTIILTQGPKINLERLIKTTNPYEIIADGNNYTSYIHRWKGTCLKPNIPFHFTGEKGAYYFKQNGVNDWPIQSPPLLHRKFLIRHPLPHVPCASKALAKK